MLEREDLKYEAKGGETSQCKDTRVTGCGGERRIQKGRQQEMMQEDKPGSLSVPGHAAPPGSPRKQDKQDKDYERSLELQLCAGALGSEGGKRRIIMRQGSRLLNWERRVMPSDLLSFQGCKQNRGIPGNKELVKEGNGRHSAPGPAHHPVPKLNREKGFRIRHREGTT